jgi:hypothetical protein
MDGNGILLQDHGHSRGRSQVACVPRQPVGDVHEPTEGDPIRQPQGFPDPWPGPGKGVPEPLRRMEALDPHRHGTRASPEPPRDPHLVAGSASAPEDRGMGSSQDHDVQDHGSRRSSQVPSQDEGTLQPAGIPGSRLQLSGLLPGVPGSQRHGEEDPKGLGGHGRQVAQGCSSSAVARLVEGDPLPLEVHVLHREVYAHDDPPLKDRAVVPRPHQEPRREGGLRTKEPADEVELRPSSQAYPG